LLENVLTKIIVKA